MAALALALGLAVDAVRPGGSLVFTSNRLPSGEFITLDEARRLHGSGTALFLDARGQLEFESGHIAGALNLPPEEFEYSFAALEGLIGRAGTVITYCDGEGCMLSRDLAALLRARGLGRVFVLKDGWRLWTQAGLPTATGPGNPGG